jgi:hypothetical protein
MAEAWGRERCASQTSNGPGSTGLAPPHPQRLDPVGVARGHVAEHHGPVAGHLLGGARERVGRAEVERALEQAPAVVLSRRS